MCVEKRASHACIAQHILVHSTYIIHIHTHSIAIECFSLVVYCIHITYGIITHYSYIFACMWLLLCGYNYYIILFVKYYGVKCNNFLEVLEVFILMLQSKFVLVNIVLQCLFVQLLTTLYPNIHLPTFICVRS